MAGLSLSSGSTRGSRPSSLRGEKVWIGGSSPPMENKVTIKNKLVIAGLAPAIHRAAHSDDRISAQWITGINSVTTK
jgi:hypothetical protein